MRKTRVDGDENELSVEEALQDAIMTPLDGVPEVPQLPIQHANSHPAPRRSVPKPLFAGSHHQLRGFNPSPVEPLPHIDNFTASNEHAFAGRDEGRKRPFRPPLGVQVMRSGQDTNSLYDESQNSSPRDLYNRPPSSPLLTPPASPHVKNKSLRGSKSVGEGLRSWKKRLSSPNRGKMRSIGEGEIRSPTSFRPSIPSAEVRDSIRSGFTSSRSAVTSNSSFFPTSSIRTDHSSLLTANSSHNSDFIQVYPNWPDTQIEDEDESGVMTVEDAISMYVDGFESARPSHETQGRKSYQGTISAHNSRPTSQPTAPIEKAKRPNLAHRRSQSASMLLRAQTGDGDSLSPRSINRAHTFSRILINPAIMGGGPIAQPAVVHGSGAMRDRYGFKKANLYINAQQYDEWDVEYSEHLERRRKKWHALMNSYGLNIEKPFRFPPKNDKIKRYVRKGIPPEFRGAAWFWYAGGPGKLAKEPGLYFELLEQVKNGDLSDNDREHIERDLNRTFPDNVRFKPDPTTTLDAQADAGGGDASTKKKSRQSKEPETPIVLALRRVLQAFAVHNPSIGYCQSLNFIAGLLLLFLDQDEEKAFVLLNIVTSVHLPGTHGVTLEGANIDIAVLMSCIKETLPAIWAKLDDKGSGPVAPFPSAQVLRLPTVSLATTAWFMSLFVGTLPIESVLRVWDCLFFEGSKTLFRIAMAIFKFGERTILTVNDPMEIFQVVQTIPRSMLDINGLMEVCFRRRGGFGHISQGLIESRREERRQAVKDGAASVSEERKVWKGRWRAKTKV